MIAKMDKKQINYTVVENLEEISKIGEESGIDSLPILAITKENETSFLDFAKAVKWVGEQ